MFSTLIFYALKVLFDHMFDESAVLFWLFILMKWITMLFSWLLMESEPPDPISRLLHLHDVISVLSLTEFITIQQLICSDLNRTSAYYGHISILFLLSEVVSITGWQWLKVIQQIYSCLHTSKGWSSNWVIKSVLHYSVGLFASKWKKWKIYFCALILLICAICRLDEYMSGQSWRCLWVQMRSFYEGSYLSIRWSKGQMVTIRPETSWRKRRCDAKKIQTSSAI